jgi:radical SAM superfamily enzyme YgiQ (UPF0313 family)
MPDKVMLLYPPGKMYQRGEDRSQGNIEQSTATAMRACNDLGYCAAMLEQLDYAVFLRDYQSEKKSFADVEADIKTFQPDLIMLSITNGTIFSDLAFVRQLKEQSPAKIALKGALFYDAAPEMLALLDLSDVDYLIGGEAETCLGEIAQCALRNVGTAAGIDNIFYKDGKGVFVKTRFQVWEDDLDAIPFPARKYMNNKLYTRPDTGEAMATIQTSRGCAAACTYCLSPIISGKKIRYRSVDNVLAELTECYCEHGIKNFFFKSDTFTMDAAWAEALCDKIIASPLHGKIQFTANSRVNPLRKETLALMKQAGCFAVAFGFESGSDNTLRRIKKGATVRQNLQAAEWAREVGLPVYGFFMFGFPWETRADLEATKAHIFAIGADFIEIHVALPYYGTELYGACRQEGTLGKETLGSDYFNSNITGTKTLPLAELLAFKQRTLREYYLRPSYILRQLGKCLNRPKVFFNYAKYGWKIVFPGGKS